MNVRGQRLDPISCGEALAIPGAFAFFPLIPVVEVMCQQGTDGGGGRNIRTVYLASSLDTINLSVHSDLSAPEDACIYLHLWSRSSSSKGQCITILDIENQLFLSRFSIAATTKTASDTAT